MTAAAATLWLPVGGMTCAACQARVHSALLRAPGVLSVHVDLAARSASVTVAVGTAPHSIVQAIESSGYTAELVDADDVDAQNAARLHSEYRRSAQRAWGATAGLVAVAALSMLAMRVDRAWLAWLVCALALVTILLAGSDVLRGAVAAVRHRHANMNVLVAIGVGGSMAWSVASLLHLTPTGAHDWYFEAAVGVLTFVLIGQFLETRARVRSRAGLVQLAALLPMTVRIRDTDVAPPVDRDIATRDLRKGDVLVIRPSERVAADVVLLDGTSSFDESVLTGEALPVARAAGDAVPSGARNGERQVLARVVSVGKDSTTARIARLVTSSQASKASFAQLADTWSARFVPVVLLISAVTFGVWWAVADVATAVRFALAVTVVSCPCAMGLAVPAALAAATARAVSFGVIFKDVRALEKAARVDTVVFDKTGTVTTPTPTLRIALQPGAPLDALLLAASCAATSEHVLSRALVAHARGAGLVPLAAHDVEAHLGAGVQAKVGRHLVRVGSYAFAQASAAAAEQTSMDAPLWVAIDDAMALAVEVDDTLRADALPTLNALKNAGYQLSMLSGDKHARVARVAQQLGITAFEGGLLPAQKLAAIDAMRAAGRVVAMVGDGVNDAPALAHADLGIALSTSSLMAQTASSLQLSDVALAAADAVVLGRGLAAVTDALRLARAAVRIMRQNLFWAFAYNVVAIALAAGVFFPAFGFALSPLWAGAAMAASSLSVVSNSMRLMRAGQSTL